MDDDLPAYRTRASLRDDLRRLGVRAGDTVMLHAAMRRCPRSLVQVGAGGDRLPGSFGPERSG